MYTYNQLGHDIHFTLDSVNKPTEIKKLKSERNCNTVAQENLGHWTFNSTQNKSY